MTIPSLRSCDRAAFAQQIASLAARAQEARPRPISSPAPGAAPAAPPMGLAIEPELEDFALPPLEVLPIDIRRRPRSSTELEFMADDLEVDPMSIEIANYPGHGHAMAEVVDEDELVIPIDHIAHVPEERSATASRRLGRP